MLKNPMLACSTIPAFEDLQFPLIASFKLDGIRCLVSKGQVRSRTLKAIPNNHVCQLLSAIDLPVALDGELMVDGEFNDVQSAIMSQSGTPNFTYLVFDIQTTDVFKNRMEHAAKFVADLDLPYVKVVEQRLIRSRNELVEFYSEALAKGYEGLILRSPNSPYKHGRSTLKQGWMLKLKPFEDAEAVVICMNPLMRNMNEAEKNELGYNRRGHSSENKVPDNMLGSLTCQWNGVEFEVGTGFNDAERYSFWERDLVGAAVTFKYQGVGPNGKPRFPVFKSVRLPE